MTGRNRRTPYVTVENPAVEVEVSRETTHERAASARRDAYAGVKPTDRGMVDALLAERRGYEQRDGMDDRIAQVDEQLRVRGYETA